MSKHAFAPHKGVATVVTSTVEQFAKVHVKIAKKGIEAINVAKSDAQVASVFAGPRFKAKDLTVAQPRSQGLASLQIFMGHGSQGCQAQRVCKIHIAGTRKLTRLARPQAPRQNS